MSGSLPHDAKRDPSVHRIANPCGAETSVSTKFVSTFPEIKRRLGRSGLLALCWLVCWACSGSANASAPAGTGLVAQPTAAAKAAKTDDAEPAATDKKSKRRATDEESAESAPDDEEAETESRQPTKRPRPKNKPKRLPRPPPMTLRMTEAADDEAVG